MVSPGFPLADVGLTERKNGAGATGPDESPDANITGRTVTIGCADVTGGNVGFCTNVTVRAGVLAGIAAEVSTGTALFALPVVTKSCGCVVTGFTGIPAAEELDFPGPGLPEYVITANAISPTIRIPAKISKIKNFLSF